ncbi:unnamed protein product [Candidula unifasciata]|uniref:G-protein coupled receptors family 1 profile domain-containing protein n=1 Tax=Candidula unifasciata TaxID=100452 RepID=A0A8S3Z6M0_9EUPU|nr:unnamed protein product [Candidula unifasciata]
MAAERYIAVCHPLQARKLISLKRTRASIFIVFFVCSASTIPIFLERTIEQVTCYDGRIIYVLVERSEAFVRLRRILWATFYDFLPSAALVYFNFCLIYQIHKAKQLREQMIPKHSVIFCSSSGTKISVHRLKTKHNMILNAQTSEETPVTESKKSLLSLKYLRPETRSHNGQQCSSKVNEYSKFDVSSNGSQKRSNHSCSENNTQRYKNNFELNDLRTDPEATSSIKLRDQGTRNVSQKRPSDSALNSVTATLVAVVLLFLILVSPSELMKFSVSYTSANKDQQLIVTYVTNFMQVLNFSLNFVLYCAVNKSFRHTLRGLACCLWLSIHG